MSDSDQTQQISEVLFDRGTLVDLYIGRPTGIRKLSAGDLLQEGIDDNAILLGHKKIYPRKALKPFIDLESRARTLLASKSLPFPVGHARFVYFRTLNELLNTFNQISQAWDRELEALIDGYDGMKEEQLKVLDSQAEELYRHKLAELSIRLSPDKLEEKREELLAWLAMQRVQHREYYPTADLLRGKFAFRWRTFRISTVEGFSEMSDIELDELHRARSQLQEDLRQWTREASAAMHKSLGDAAANAANLLRRQGKLNPKNLKPLFDAFDSFKAVDFTGSSRFHHVIEEIRSRYLVTDLYGNTDFTLSAEAASRDVESVEDLLDTIGELATESVAERAGLDSLSEAPVFRRVIKV